MENLTVKTLAEMMLLAERDNWSHVSTTKVNIQLNPTQRLAQVVAH